MALELPKFGNKEKKEKASAPKNDVMLKIMDFFDKNPLMKILIPVVLFLILAGIILFLIFGDGVLLGANDVDTTGVANMDEEVQVLPSKDDLPAEIEELIEKDPLSEDILASAVYKGFTSDSRSGLKVALVQFGTAGEYVKLSKGQTVGEWELTEITPDYVVFKAGEVTKEVSRG